MKKCLYLLSPSDRFNYGDMLFSYILKHYLKDSVDLIMNCSTSESDYSAFGAMPTLGYNEIFRADPSSKNHLIVAGGECLFVDWLVIQSFLYKDIHFLGKKISNLPHLFVLKSLVCRLLKLYAKIVYHSKTRFPFTVGLFEIKNFSSVMYNSVGCVGLQHKKKLLKCDLNKKIMQSAAYVSVRDSATSKGLDMMGVSYRRVPDCAILMSDVFTDSFLEERRSSRLSLKKGDYIFFQINMLSSKGKEKFFASILNDVAVEYNKKILLCPIGTALGHEDDVALRNVAKYLNDGVYVFEKDLNLWNIMYFIKNSCLYFGTSLHGAITATSFSVPMVTHGKQKVAQYIKDWGGVFCDVSDLRNAVFNQLRNPLIPSSQEQKALALNSIRQMKSIIDKT